MAETEIAALLAATLDPRHTKIAEEKLRPLEAGLHFPLHLTQIAVNHNADAVSRLAAAIYLKNYVIRRWALNDCEEAITGEVKSSTRSAVLRAATALPAGPALDHLKRALQVIGECDFPDRWMDLLLEVVRSPENAPRGLNIVDLVLRQFRTAEADTFTLGSLKFIVDPGSIDQKMVHDFLPFWLRFLVSSCSASSAEALIARDSALEILYSLIMVDLPEFVEDNLPTIMECCAQAMKVRSEGTVAALRALTIFASRYETEFEPFVSPLVDAILNLTAACKDDLVSGAEAKSENVFSNNVGDHHHSLNSETAMESMLFLSSVAKRRWEGIDHPFASAERVRTIIEQLVVPLCRLTREDLNLLEETPTEFLKDDAAGDNLRGATVSLAVQLGQLHGAEMSVTLKRALVVLTERKQADEEIEGAVNILIATSIKKQSRFRGVVEVCRGLDPQAVYLETLLPFMQSPAKESLLPKMAAIKFGTTFRNQLSDEALSGLFIAIADLIERLGDRGSPLLLTHCCIALDALLSSGEKVVGPLATTFTGPLRLPKLANIQQAAPMLVPFLINAELDDKEVSMRLLYRLVAHFGQNIIEQNAQYLYSLIHHINETITYPLIGPVVHFIFETLAAVTRHLREGKPELRELWTQQRLLPMLSGVLEAPEHDYTPYAYQLLGLAVQSGADIVQWGQLLEYILNEERWSGASVASLRAMTAVILAYTHTSSTDRIEKLRSASGLIIDRLCAALHDRRVVPMALEAGDALLLRCRPSADICNKWVGALVRRLDDDERGLFSTVVCRSLAAVCLAQVIDRPETMEGGIQDGRSLVTAINHLCPGSFTTIVKFLGDRFSLARPLPSQERVLLISGLLVLLASMTHDAGDVEAAKWLLAQAVDQGLSDKVDAKLQPRKRQIGGGSEAVEVKAVPSGEEERHISGESSFARLSSATEPAGVALRASIRAVAEPLEATVKIAGALARPRLLDNAPVWARLEEFLTRGLQQC